MPDLKFGWFMYCGGMPGQKDLPIVMAEQAEVLPAVNEHFDSIWVHDHFWAFEDPQHEVWLEAWTVVTWLAARFPKLDVGTIVLGVGYRNPALLAKMASTLQTLSGGRHIMGIGAGWREPEYLAYGYDFPAPAVRMKQLEEAIRIMRLMWTEHAPSFEGKYHSIKEAICEPRPQQPIPIMIGGGGPKLLLPIAGRYADIWDLWYGGKIDGVDLAGYREKRDILRAAAQQAGRDPQQIRQSFTLENMVFPETAAEAETFQKHLRELIDLGVSQFILGFGAVSDPKLVEKFASDVIAPLRAG